VLLVEDDFRLKRGLPDDVGEDIGNVFGLLVGFVLEEGVPISSLDVLLH
jgi:tetrahydromethanopterin S-methyltransferase subunit G